MSTQKSRKLTFMSDLSVSLSIEKYALCASTLNKNIFLLFGQYDCDRIILLPLKIRLSLKSKNYEQIIYFCEVITCIQRKMYMPFNVFYWKIPQLIWQYQNDLNVKHHSIFFMSNDNFFLKKIGLISTCIKKYLNISPMRS